MGFLKKLGTILLKGTAVVAGVGPLISNQVPAAIPVLAQVTDTLARVAGVVTQMELVGQALGLAGPDKLKGAAPAVAQVILESSLLVGRKIKDPELFKRGCTSIGSGMADVLNSLDDDIAVEEKSA